MSPLDCLAALDLSVEVSVPEHLTGWMEQPLVSAAPRLGYPTFDLHLIDGSVIVQSCSRTTLSSPLFRDSCFVCTPAHRGTLRRRFDIFRNDRCPYCLSPAHGARSTLVELPTGHRLTRPVVHLVLRSRLPSSRSKASTSTAHPLVYHQLLPPSIS